MSLFHEHGGHSHDEGSLDERSLDRADERGRKGLLMALVITAVMMIAEVIGGLLANSLALLSDAGHMLTDTLALALSFFAMKFAALPATERKTFGFYRLEILAALVNGMVLVIVSLYIGYHAYYRIINPQPVEGELMLGVAAIGLFVNIAGAMFLIKHKKTSLNIRGAYLHIVGDALSSLGVIVGGIIILYTGWNIVDPILSIIIALGIIVGAVALVMESVQILLESAPSHISVAAVAAEMEKIKGVREAYHVHLWTITSGMYAMSAHVLIDDQLVSKSREILDDIRRLLSDRFKIFHSTIQLECEKCDATSACALPVGVAKNQKDDGLNP